MFCKSVISNWLTVVGILVEISTDIAKPKCSLDAYLFIRQPPSTVTYIDLVISPSQYSFFFKKYAKVQ